MKLLAYRNETHCVFSVTRYDYRTHGDLMADGGQPHDSFSGGGYTRSQESNIPVWIALPGVSFADLKQDYVRHSGGTRKYGVHELEDVVVLASSNPYEGWDEDDVALEYAVWGTRGVDGTSPIRYVMLKDCTTDHLNNILKMTTVGDRYRALIEYILQKRSSSDFLLTKKLHEIPNDVLINLKRDHLRKIASINGIKRGRNKKDTLENILKKKDTLNKSIDIPSPTGATISGYILHEHSFMGLPYKPIIKWPSKKIN